MSSDTLMACAVCFARADGPMLDAARLGVLVMAGVTCIVLALFARFFLHLAKNGDSPHFQNGDNHRFGRGLD